MKFTLCDSHPGFKTYLIHLTFSRQSYHYTLSCLSILGATFPLSQNLQHELFRLARRLFGTFPPFQLRLSNCTQSPTCGIERAH